MNRKEVAAQTFKNCFNCCQSTLVPFCEELGLDKETALKLASGFGGGMRRGEVCGAVSGGIMALGLAKGHCKGGDVDSKNKANALAKEFEDRFEEVNGTIFCRELLGYNVSIESEMAIIKEKGLINKLCPEIIDSAIEIVEDMLKD